ncbi:FecR family protein [Pedobacter arcticus]|uniref:FecR family protein n=1 Tax=Pedobacter arcticus TaxID=752140 RepID=UPI0002E48E09|nr:FecR family protein [Pedobacter arcticus]
MTEEKFKSLLNNYLEGTASEQDQQRLINFYDDIQKDKLSWITSEMGEQEQVRQALLNKINDRLDCKSKKLKNKNRWQLSIAASLILLLSIGSYTYLKLHQKEIAYHQKSNEIKPGCNKAILTLANGKKISLDDSHSGKIVEEAGVLITKTGEGKLVYNVVTSKALPADVAITYNTISTPKGGQYQIDLPDGTKVWLNAASSLKYPIQFKTNERIVELSGEGYFEVAKDKSRPFKVITAMQQVEVLGTHFNINSYSDEPSVKTTLLEGKVSVFPLYTNKKKGNPDTQHAILKPNQQSVMIDQQIKVLAIDAQTVIDWRNGEFIFNDEPIKTAMRKLARWYDVDVVYEGNFDDIYFGGSFSKFVNLNESVKILESTNKLRCKIIGRRVYMKR